MMRYSEIKLTIIYPFCRRVKNCIILIKLAHVIKSNLNAFSGEFL